MIKKAILSTLLYFLFIHAGQAQIGHGGFPLSTMQKELSTPQIPVVQATLPDWDQAQAENKKKADNGFSTPFIIGLFSQTDISFPGSGTFTYLDNGHIIWRSRLVIDGAPAIGLYYDRFHLPEGVSLFLSNENGKQVLGAYNQENNSANGIFANEPVQGSQVNLELDIAPGVDMEHLSLHINRAAVYYTSISYLSQYASAGNDLEARPTGDPDPYGFEGRSSTCEIDATCPLGQDYPIQRKSTVQLIIPIDSSYVGLCSGIMINNTGNTTANCKPYVLTATHCEENNYSSSNNFTFQNMFIRFNFEKTSCNSTVPATVNTLYGADLIARSNYINSTVPSINGDFLLLEPEENIPVEWDVYLSGWNRAENLPSTLTNGKKYFGFHHPAGDVKKVTTFQYLYPDADANGSAGPGTHWGVMVDEGGIEQGSSGSALFDENGLSIGVASVAGDQDMSCSVNGNGGQAMFLKEAAYSKLSYDWDYSEDGPADFRKLKPWLDPVNSGVITLNAVHSNCTTLNGDTIPGPGVGIKMPDHSIDPYVHIYPNPSTSGMVHASFNFPAQTGLHITIFDWTGKKIAAYSLPHVQHDAYSFDLSKYANGAYFIKFSSKSATSTKKIMLLRQ